MNAAADVLAAQIGALSPAVAMILGSGLGVLSAEVEEPVRIPYADLPGFPRAGVSGHEGEVVAGRLAGVPVLLLSGRAHYYETGDAAAMRPALECLKALGVSILVLTNAAGSANPGIAPGEVMLIEDHINYSGRNPLIGETSEERFVDMTAAYDLDLRAAMVRAAKLAGVPLHEGVYLWFSGPSFETPAEVRMARRLGADALGMSSVPETILARFLGFRVVGASVITNYGAGMTGRALSHRETKEIAPRGGETLSRILKAALPEFV